MSKPIILPDDIKKSCLCIVRGYKRRCNAYRDARRAAIGTGGGGHYETVKKEGKYVRVYFPRTSATARGTEDQSIRLNEIEQSPETKRMRAVQWASLQIGNDLPDHIRKPLADAIILSCENGKRHPFEKMHVEGIGKTDFFKRRTTFLADVAKYLEFI